MAFAVAALLSVSVLAGGHPGHGTMVMMGNLVTVEKDVLTFEIRDLATTQLRRVRVLVDKDTKTRVGKEPVDPATMIGARAVIGVDYEEGPAGDTIYRGSDIRLSKPKPKS